MRAELWLSAAQSWSVFLNWTLSQLHAVCGLLLHWAHVVIMLVYDVCVSVPLVIY